MNATATGSRDIQQSDISWSYRSLGNVARNQTKRKIIKHVLPPNAIDCKFKYVLFVIKSGPNK